MSACRVGGHSELLEDAESTEAHSAEGGLRGLGRSEIGFLRGSGIVVERGVWIEAVAQPRRGFGRVGESAGGDREPAHQLA